ncbi:MAG: leucine-rich repeat protein [Lachnospiraceae bacterium]|nr:leucine-rich repeat protein [Lachnospiraceae bacterium]
MRRKFWWKQLVFMLCFALTAGMVSPVVSVSAEELQESVAVEMDAEAEQIEESSVMEVTTELEANEEQSLTISGNDVVAEAATDLSYTDENGNVFIYILDESGNATITGITVSGAALVIPEVINEVPVIAVDNANQRVVMNPEVAIPELTINCHTIGERAFYGTSIGTLTIGEDVKAFVVCNDGDYSYNYYYLQFAYAKIDKVVFQATELVAGLNTGKSTDTFYGPFYRASIGALEIGSGVTLIPEMLFCGASMELETLELQVERIGAYAFSGSGITIEHLILGEGVKCFEVFSNSSSLNHYWHQFSSANIGKLTFYANDLQIGRPVESNGSRDLFPPFQNATIGSLEIGSEITRIPEMFIHGAKITIEELRITQPVVEAYAFCGSNISIGTLVLDSTLESFEESYYSTNLFHHFNQFSYANIGTLKLYTPDLQVNKKYEKSTNSDVFSGFYGATVGSLEIGSEVQAIPEYFLYYATMNMEELNIHTPEIGPNAFGGGKISFGTLTIGKEVTTFPESFYSTGIFHYWRQFANCSIGHLIYEADAAAVENDVETITSASADLDGPFIGASIGTLTLKENVTCIPDYLLRGAKLVMEELEVHVQKIGAMAFMSSEIFIGKLTIGEDVAVFQKSDASNNTYNLWEQFGLVTIGELYFNAPSLTLSREAEYDNICEGPFYQSKIGHLYLGEQVERIPAYCFIGAYLEQEELEIHAKSIGVRAFAGANMVIGTLTIGAEVETFENIVSGGLLFYRQFANNKITTLKYLPVSLQTADDCYKGIFDEATIGHPEFGEAVEVVPNYLFYNAIINLDEYTLNVPTIGCFAFSGSKIVFQKLTIGEDVTTFVADSDSASKAFDKSTINALYYNATEAQTSVLNHSVYGPFSYNTKVKALYVGDNVKVIPHGCFKGTTMNLEELTIENAAIGYDAFNGRNIKIGTLNLGKNVNYVGVVSGGTNNFAWANIETLNYNSNAVDPDWSASASGTGMFYFTTIGQLNIGPDVEVIPALWFRSATIEQDILTIPCNWSYCSFYSNDIVVGTLILNGDFEAIHYRGNGNFGFQSITAETVIYDIPAAGITSTDAKTYGPFYGADITNFVLGEHVEFIHSQLLRGNEFTNCYVYPVDAGEGYLEQTFTKSYLPTTEHLYVHYYSDFRAYFDNQVTDYHWLCVDYFDKTYGDKIYDEETGEYVVEIFKTCSVCGYEEQGTEELDNSYDVYLSIPVEIPLAFDSEEQAYIGSEKIYAYGTLGNAYEGLQIVVDRDSESYGKAVMGESSYLISSYLSVGFQGGDAAVFSLEQLEANATCVQTGEAVAYQDEMQVQVDALAFIEGGAGYYQISIPIRMELQH